MHSNEHGPCGPSGSHSPRTPASRCRCCEKKTQRNKKKERNKRKPRFLKTPFLSYFFPRHSHSIADTLSLSPLPLSVSLFIDQRFRALRCPHGLLFFLSISIITPNIQKVRIDSTFSRFAIAIFKVLSFFLSPTTFSIFRIIFRFCILINRCLLCFLLSICVLYYRKR